jgi:CubicO group peptidase (beta-lactamase class C family)
VKRVGIADDADEETGESYEALWVDKPVYSVMRTRDFLPQFAYKPPNFPPGGGCRYCNVGYVLVGLAIEEITATTYRDHVRAVLPHSRPRRGDAVQRRARRPDVIREIDRRIRAS